MKQMNVWRVLLLCLLTLSFASCGDDVYYTLKNSDEDLCDKFWITSYEEGEVSCSYQLNFFSGGKGEERLSRPVSTGTEVTYKEINWRWTDDSKECLQWSYTDGSVRYLENVWVRQHYLSGELDGKQLVFVESGYQH